MAKRRLVGYLSECSLFYVVCSSPFWSPVAAGWHIEPRKLSNRFRAICCCGSLPLPYSAVDSNIATHLKQALGRTAGVKGGAENIGEGHPFNSRGDSMG